MSRYNFDAEAFRNLQPHLFAGDECERYQEAMKRQGMIISGNGKGGCWQLPDFMLDAKELKLRKRKKGDSHVEILDEAIIEAQDSIEEE